MFFKFDMRMGREKKSVVLQSIVFIHICFVQSRIYKCHVVIVAVISFLIKTAYNREKKRPATKKFTEKKIIKKKYNYNRTVKGQKFVHSNGWMDGQNRHFHLCDWYHLHKVKRKKKTRINPEKTTRHISDCIIFTMSYIWPDKRIQITFTVSTHPIIRILTFTQSQQRGSKRQININYIYK